MMKKITIAVVLALACTSVGAQSDYSDGEFEGHMGWIPDDDRSSEYYLGYSEGRGESEDLYDAWVRMQKETDIDRRHREILDALEDLADD